MQRVRKIETYNVTNDHYACDLMTFLIQVSMENFIQEPLPLTRAKRQQQQQL